MCDECAAEYKNPANRRFHAQPDACFECGPHISFYEFDGNECVFWGRTLEESDAIIARAAQMLIWGEALAVKGLGGFHLVCDARNSAAVAQLRAAKHRGNKPFAVMMRNVADVKRVCYVSAAEEEQLTSPARPIVLLRRRAGAAAAGAESADVALEGAGQDSATNTQELKGVADGLSELGVMLPSTPVQHLLLQAVSECGANFPILVMTSGNVCGNPIITQDAAAREKFRGIASAVLGNDREILSRFDDSVLRVLDVGAAGSCVQMVRRARGYAPLPLDVSFLAGAQVAGGAAEGAEGAEATGAGDIPPIFATGPEQKNTCTYLVRGKAYVSQHIGDLENVETYNAWLEAKARLEHLFNIAPDQALLACDAHPSYMSTQWAQQQNKKVSRVQHHHAHVAAVMAENKLEQATCGIAFDGTGYGAEGSIWGGEVLICNLRDFERFANFAYVPMPGGAACVREPLRMAYGVLHAFDLLEHPVAQEIFARASETEKNFSAETLDQMIDQGINTPYTSSVGRLFDAASAILGVCTHPTYQGEAAILLEAAMGAREGALVEGSPFDIAITKNFATKNSTALDTSVLLLDAAPLFEALLNSIAAGASVATISRHFHNAFVQAIVQMAQVVQQVYGISTVALSGGVFMNRYIAEHSIAALSAQGFTVALNKDLPPNDGSISFGEAVVTYAKQHPTPQH